MRGSPKASHTELELASGPAVFPAQHLRLYHHDFPVQIILIGNGDAALRCNGAVVYALYAGLIEFYVGFLRLLGNPLSQWQDTVRYLTGDERDFASVKEIKVFIKQELEAE